MELALPLRLPPRLARAWSWQSRLWGRAPLGVGSLCVRTSRMESSHARACPSCGHWGGGGSRWGSGVEEEAARVGEEVAAGGGEPTPHRARQGGRDVSGSRHYWRWKRSC